MQTSTSAPGDTLLDPDPHRVDWLVAALDQRSIDNGRTVWLVDVVGAHEAAGELWLQVAPHDDATEGVVLHMFPWNTVADAIAALESWNRQPMPYPRILHLTSE
jgi:hypothetical protein